MVTTLLDLAGRGHAAAGASRADVAAMALAERSVVDRAAGRRPFASIREYEAQLARRTVCLTLLAGSGSRWVKSLAAASEKGAGIGFDPARPRGLYPVRDFLGGGRAIPIAAYSLAAVDGLGRHLIVVRGWEEEIDAEILSRLRIGAEDRDFFTQAAPYGKPLGHGDAAWQCRGFLRGADYVIANFGGDANSRRTILSSLLALDALRSAGVDVGLMIPAAPLDSPAYPIGLDEEGLPRSFGHAKLQGINEPQAGSRGRTGGRGYTNVGVRVYSAPALLAKLESFRARFWVEGSGYAIPGNDPEGHEFALDNVDAELAAEGKARILAIARPEELCPAKSVNDVPAFERAVESVIAEDRAGDL
jgi:hypothetical protein